jgi:hypothetical protein
MKSKWKLTHGNTVSIEVLAEQKLPTSAVEALLAKLGVARIKSAIVPKYPER